MANSTHTLEEAVALVHTADHVGFPLGPGQPGGFLHALNQRTDWDGLELYGALLVDLYEVFLQPGVHYRSGFFGPAERFLRDAGANVEFVPADFRRFAPVLQAVAPRVMCTSAAPPDPDGWMSLSLHAGATVDELHRAGADPDRILVVEVSPHFPRTLGLGPDHRHAIHVSEADVIVETDRVPFVLADVAPTPVEQAIADHARAFVTDGCTLQTGIGAIPSAIATALAVGDGGDFGVHSEMFTTGLMRLHQAGKVTNNKGIFDGVSITTFAAGEPELYTWLEGNTEVRFLPVDVVNSPEIIARNRKLISINGALSVDLSGQIVADTIGGKQFSGIGGHEDFMAGAGLELEDRSLVCLPSMTVVGEQPVSRIVGAFPAGTVVTTPRHQVDVVITEHGVAELQGLTIRERARALAAIADPSMRDDLLEKADRWPID